MALIQEIQNGQIVETKEHTGEWAWKHFHQADGTTTYKKLEGDVVFDDRLFRGEYNIVEIGRSEKEHSILLNVENSTVYIAPSFTGHNNVEFKKLVTVKRKIITVHRFVYVKGAVVAHNIFTRHNL